MNFAGNSVMKSCTGRNDVKQKIIIIISLCFRIYVEKAAIKTDRKQALHTLQTKDVCKYIS